MASFEAGARACQCSSAEGRDALDTPKACTVRRDGRNESVISRVRKDFQIVIYSKTFYSSLPVCGIMLPRDEPCDGEV